MKSYLPRDDSKFWHIRFLPKISLHAYQNWIYIALYFVRSFFLTEIQLLTIWWWFYTMCTSRWFSYMFFRLFSTIGYYKILSLLSMLHSKSLLLIYFMYSNLYLLTHTPKPKAHFICYHLYVESNIYIYIYIYTHTHTQMNLYTKQK